MSKNSCLSSYLSTPPRMNGSVSLKKNTSSRIITAASRIQKMYFFILEQLLINGYSLKYMSASLSLLETRPGMMRPPA